MTLLKKKKQNQQPEGRSVFAIKKERREVGEQILAMRSGLTPEKPDFSPEENTQWTKLNSRYDNLGRELQIAKRAEKIQAHQEEQEDAAPGREDFLPPALRHLSKKSQRSEGEHLQQTTEQRCADSNMALRAWFKRQTGSSLNASEVAACQRIGFNPKQRGLTFNLLGSEAASRLQKPYQISHPHQARQNAERVLEQRGFNTYDPAAGGVLVNPMFATQLELAMLDYSGVMQVAETITTSTGAELRWPTGNDTSNTGELVSAGGTPSTDTTTPFGSKSWFAYKFSSKSIKVDQELIEDNSFNLPAVVAGMLGERLGRSINSYCTTGNGGNEPEGIVTGSSLGNTTASATAVTAAELIVHQHTVDPAYRAGAAWMMNDGILAQIRKLADSTGRFHFNMIDGIKDGVPDRLLGWPVYLNQSMQATLASATKTILAGQLSKYKLRRVNQVRMYRLQERYRDTDQDGFIAFVRIDGKLLNAGVNPVKHLLQAT